MDRFTGVLAGLLGRSAGLLPAARRQWAQAVLAEAGEVPAGAGRVAWLCGGLWLVAREVVMGKVVRVLAFAAGAVGLAWIGWPGASSNSATPLNRMYVIGTVVYLAVLPWVVRRNFGPVRGGWAPRAARVAGYAMVLVLIAAKAAKDRDGSRLGAYFVIVPGLWALEMVLLLVIVGYLAALFILTTERIRLTTRWGLPAGLGLGVVTAGVLYPLAPFGVNVDPNSPSLPWWLVAALALPIATGLLVGRLAARDTRPGALNPIQQGGLAAACAMATSALLVAVLTSVTIALFPHQVPLQGGDSPGYIAGGGCETCDPNNTVIPPGLRHEYWVEISVGQAGQAPLAFLLLGPLLGAGLGALAGGFASRSRGTSGHGGGPHVASLPAPSEPLVGRASDADREQVLGVLKAAFVQGRLTKDELDTRTGHALTAGSNADLAALTADLHQPPRPS
jgi:DUF1707 SHOCT-like domain